MEVEIPGVSSLSPKEKQDLLLGPAIALPPGVESHFGELPPRSPAILLDWVAIFVPKTRSAFFWVSHILLGVNVLFYLAVLILANLLCTPPEHAWDPLTEGHCNDVKRPEVVGAALNSASDVIIFVLPQTVIWKLRMSRKQRLGYSILFAIGLAAVAASGARLVSLIYQYHGGDETYNAAPFLLWSLAEMTCIFLVLCVPSTPKAFQNLRLWQHVSSTLPSPGSLVSSPKLALVRTRRPLSQRKMTEPDSHYQTIADNIPLRVVESGTLSSANSVLEA
ncbi:hypothetical protein F4825DRAFT_472892 [Nemania diffusa]|nr:hypothetical protein F4825DRAFT_472892 [Nemania diffusa]